MAEEAPKRDYPLREVFNGLRWFVRAGCPWRMVPNDLPPWSVIYQQTRRWIKAGRFEAMAHDLRAVYRVQTHTNLANPAGWVTVSTNAAPFTFTDTNVVSGTPQRFYRVVSP